MNEFPEGTHGYFCKCMECIKMRVEKCIECRTKKAEPVTRIVSCSICAVYDPPFAGTRSFAAQTPLGGGN